MLPSEEEKLRRWIKSVPVSVIILFKTVTVKTDLIILYLNIYIGAKTDWPKWRVYQPVSYG